MSAQQTFFEEHLKEPGFVVGAKSGMWGIIKDVPASLGWPAALFWVKAAARADCPDRYYLKFQMTGYPSTAPSATLWDPVKDQKLEDSLWPKGDSDFNVAFSPTARPFGLYLPCDGIGRAGKEQLWKHAPEYWWTSKSKIDLYLTQVYNYLNSSRYAGK